MNTLSDQTVQRNWEVYKPTGSVKWYSGDQVIDAYMRGKKEGSEQSQKLIYDKLMANISRCGEHAKLLKDYLTSEGFHPSHIFLKIVSWDHFKFLITFPEDEFLSDQILSVYRYVSIFENKVNEEFYKLEISFTDYTENKFDNNYVVSDGFSLKYNEVEE